jgi:serine/threonine protein kinase
MSGITVREGGICFRTHMNDYLKTGGIFDDKYELLEVLGSGGVGTVYKARQLDCGRLVALKILKESAATDDEYRARFLREAQALSKLSHVNIVTVYHLGFSVHSLPYLAMEYLNGQSVRAVLNRVNNLPVLLSLRIVCDAAQALHYTHHQGIVHRDLKPENMILVPVPVPNTLKLVDFGLAGLTNLQTKEQRLTGTGELIGTSAYMSPEQCMGKAADHRTDIYSLSACLYEMMVGEKVMDADTAVGLMYKQVNAPVPEIRAEQVDRFHPILNDIISRGMSKDPRNRYASMDEMAKALDTAMTSLQSGAALCPARNYRPSIAIAAAVIWLILAIVSIRGWESYKAGRAQSDSVVMSRQEKFLRQIERLKSQIGRWKNPTTLKSPALQERYLNDLFALGRLQLISSGKQDNADAEKTYSEALDFCEHAGEGLINRKAACFALKAKAELKQGKFESSDADFNEALKLVSTESQSGALRRDILRERILLRLHTRKFADALDDFKATTGMLANANVNLATITTGVSELEQTLDKNGGSRMDMYQNIVDELLKMKPQSEEEAVQMVVLSTSIAERMGRFISLDERIRLLEFSESMLEEVRGNEKLKEHTRRLLRDTREHNNPTRSVPR